MQPTQSQIKKTVTRAVLAAALVITATIFLLNSVIINTVLSGRHFSSFYDRHQPLAVLLDTSETEAETGQETDAAGGSAPAITTAGTNTGGVLYYADQYLDREWFPDEPGILVKGLYKYIAGTSGSLPVINIGPVKGMLADVVTYEVIVVGPRDEAAFKIALIFKAFDSLIKSHGVQQGDVAIPDSKLDAIMNSAEFKALGIEIDKPTLNDVLTSYVSMRASGTGNADIMRTIVIKVLDGMAGLEDVYDELDFNILAENLFESGSNPAAELRSLVITYKIISTVILIIIIAVLLYLLLLTYIRSSGGKNASSSSSYTSASGQVLSQDGSRNEAGLQPFGAMVPAGAAFGLAGLAAFAAGLQGILLPIFGALPGHLYSSLSAPSGSSSVLPSETVGRLSGIIFQYIKEIYAALILAGLITATAGLILLIAGYILKTRPITAGVSNKLNKAAIPVIAALLILIIPLAGFAASKADRALKSVDATASSYSPERYAKALADTINAGRFYAYITSEDSGLLAFSGDKNDGSADTPENNGKPPAQTQSPSYTPYIEDNSAVSLRQFYTYLSSLENYGKAMDMLDDNFTMTLGFLKQFGVESLSKEEISEDAASEYMDILNKASITAITWTNTSGTTSRIYFNQLIEMEEGLQANSKLVADLVLRNGKWIITRIIDQSKLN